MLEDLIAKLYRKIRNRRREQLARRFDEIADNHQFYADAYAASLALAQGFQAAESLKLLSRQKMLEHRTAAQSARRRAAAIRAGHRP